MNEIVRALFSRRMLAVLLLGVSSGLPLLLIGSTLKLWMAEQAVDLTLIGFFGWVGIPFSLKFFWAPLVDWITPPFLGRRRGWILISQLALILALCAIAMTNPKEQLTWLAILCVITAVLSATQDIAIDAYRREVLRDNELALGSAMAVNGYRVGMLIAGAAPLLVAEHFSWSLGYFAMAGVIGASMLFTIFAPEPEKPSAAPATLQRALVDPFKEFFSRPGAFEVLAFILVYKIGDSMASDMFSPFYIAVGFTKPEIAYIVKTLAFWATIIGGTLGGIMMIKLNLLTCLVVFGILQAASTFGFSILAQLGHNLPALGAVMVFENFTSGLGTAAYSGLIAMLCNRRLAATQFALLSSLTSIPRTFLGGFSGYLAKHLGWSNYFIFCTLIALPGILMLLRFNKWKSSIPKADPNS